MYGVYSLGEHAGQTIANWDNLSGPQRVSAIGVPIAGLAGGYAGYKSVPAETIFQWQSAGASSRAYTNRLASSLWADEAGTVMWPSDIPRPSYVPRDPITGEKLELPRGPDGELSPSSQFPHSQVGWKEGRKGGYVQTREFGFNGKPVKQVDWTDHGRAAQGHTNPHVHDYLIDPNGGTPAHGPARPPVPGELGDQFIW